MKQSQMLFNQEIINNVVTKKMWKSLTNKEYRFIIGLTTQKYSFTERQNKWFNDIINKYKNEVL